MLWRICIFFFAVFLFPLTASSQPSEPLRFGVISLNHPLVMYRQYLPFTSYLSLTTGQDIELVVAKNYESIVSYFVLGKIDMALLAGVSYVEVSAQTAVLPLCAVRGKSGTATTRSVFIAREDRKDIQGIGDYSGTLFAFGSVHSTSSYLQPLGYLHKNGIALSSFSKTLHFPSQDSVVRAVLQAKVDGGVVSEESLVRFAGAGLKRVATTHSYPGFVIASAETVPEEVRVKIKGALLSLDTSAPELEPIVQKWSSLLQHGFSSVEDDDYDSTRALMKRLNAEGIYP